MAFLCLQEGNGQNVGILTLRRVCPAGDGGITASWASFFIRKADADSPRAACPSPPVPSVRTVHAHFTDGGLGLREVQGPAQGHHILCIMRHWSKGCMEELRGAPLLWSAKADSWVSSVAWDPSPQPCFPPARVPPLRSAYYPLPTLGICLSFLSLSQQNRIHRFLVLDLLL